MRVVSWIVWLLLLVVLPMAVLFINSAWGLAATFAYLALWTTLFALSRST